MNRARVRAQMRRALAIGGVAAAAIVAAPAASSWAAGAVNDAACKPTAEHPAPVVFLHGLGANANEDINFLQANVAAHGYCTFATTYGAWPQFPFVGGLQPVAQSAAQIKQFVEQVLAETGAAKVDVVGHSEGGFQSLYVTKTQGISDRVGRVVAIAPPTHGTTFGGLYSIAIAFGQTALVQQALGAFGCPACADLVVGGAAVHTLDNGPIAQPGVSYTIITSRYDELVTPTDTAFVHEPGVANKYVQDTCPLDPVGHIGEAYDLNVWHLVENALDPANARPFACSFGSPG